MTLYPVCESVETSQGVPLTVTGVAQCKIMKAEELLQTASEQFLGKTHEEIKSTILQTLEGHLRAILGKTSALTFFYSELVSRRRRRTTLQKCRLQTAIDSGIEYSAYR